jgi:hypothetical protein
MQMKKLYLCALLTLSIGQMRALNTNPIGAVPPNCTLVPITGATASSGNAALAVDSNGASRWESALTDNENLTVDLGAVVSVNTVTIDWETANAKNYVLRGSVDGTTWVDIHTYTNMAAGVRTDITPNINASYRYLKMDGVLRNTQYGYSIYEFYVCSTAITAPTCAPVVITSATATTGNAALAIDDIQGSRWESAAADPQEYTVNLGALTEIESVTLKWETANAKDYTLSGSADGITWVQIQAYTNMATGPRTDVIPVGTAYQYVKMLGTVRNTPYGYSLYEFDVCATIETEEPEEPVEPEEPFVCDSPLTPISAVGTTGNGAAAIDDNPGTRWNSDPIDAQSLIVDLGAVMAVTAVTIDWETANAKNYVLRGSADGIVWTDIETLTNMATGERTDVIDEIDADYRFLKMDGVMRNTIYGYSIWEFDVCGEAEPEEPFVCTPIAAVSAVGSTGNGAEAIDNNDGTRWASDAIDNQSLTVDMGAVVSITGVTIDWETANAKSYALRGSADGVVWTDIEILTDMPTGERTDVIDGIDADYRYLKMDGLVRNTIYGFSIWEFTVCGEEEPEEPQEPFECYALEATAATASSGAAAEAIDGNILSRWESAVADPQWLMVDLGAVTMVHGVSIAWETANAKNYTLSGSVDGTTWVEIEALTNMPTGERTDEIGDIDAMYRYIRMDGTVRNTPYGYSIWEMVVCGEEPEEEIEYTDVPALIQAEDWYEMSGVQTEPTADGGDGLSVGYIDAGDWMDYPIDVPAAGQYIIDARIASTADTGVIEYLTNGVSLGTVPVTNTGGWQVWQTVSKTVTLPQGEQMLRFSAAAAPFNLNWIEVKAVTSGLEGFKASGISMYPNPATGVVNVNLQEDAQLYLYTYTGSLIRQQAVMAGSNTVTLDGLAAGLYFVRVNNHVEKLIVR